MQSNGSSLLQEIIVSQDQEIQELLERLAELESERPTPAIQLNHPKPAIY